MTTYTLKGTITALEPLTVSLPGLKRGNITQLPRNGGSDKDTPYYPASSIRGSLRHAAHAVALRVAKKVTGKETPFNLNDHFMLAQGVDAAKITKNEKGSGVISFGEDVRKANPLISIFGRWGLESHLAVGNGLPREAGVWGLFGGGARAVMFERDTALLEELSDSDQQRLSTIMAETVAFSQENNDLKSEEVNLKKALRQAPDEEKKTIQARLKEIEQIRKTLKSEKEGPEESIRRPIDGYEAFSAGAELQNRITLRRSNEIEFGMFLETLAEFAREPRLGGHKSYNNGLVALHYDVSTWPEDEDVPTTIGSIIINEDGFKVKGELLLKARQSWSEALSDLDFTKFTV